jgi:drug/metabolite transporter (DMT)-like permease
MSVDGLVAARVLPSSSSPVAWRAFGFLGLMVLIGSSTAPAAKIAVRGVPVGLIPLVRFGLAGLCLWPIVGRGGKFGRMIREDGWRLFAAAALCVPINQAFFLNGAKLAPAAHIGLIYAACPLVVLALAAFLGQERLAPERILGVALSVLGVGMIAFENVIRVDAAGLDVFRGDLLEVGAVLAWGAYLTVNKPLVDRHSEPCPRWRRRSWSARSSIFSSPCSPCQDGRRWRASRPHHGWAWPTWRSS